MIGRYVMGAWHLKAMQSEDIILWSHPDRLYMTNDGRLLQICEQVTALTFRMGFSASTSMSCTMWAQIANCML